MRTDASFRAVGLHVFQISLFDILQDKTGSWPNGMKLTPARLLSQPLTQFLPGFDHQGKGVGAPFFDARLHAMRSDGVTIKAPHGMPVLGALSQRRASTKLIRSTPRC
jgi:hypothetical protein